MRTTRLSRAVHRLRDGVLLDLVLAPCTEADLRRAAKAELAARRPVAYDAPAYNASVGKAIIRRTACL